MEGEYKNIFILNWLDWNGLNVTNTACLGLSNSNPPILSLCIFLSFEGTSSPLASLQILYSVQYMYFLKEHNLLCFVTWSLRLLSEKYIEYNFVNPSTVHSLEQV